MDFWYVLGIEPTTDESAIKDAYKAMLKLNHPEDNPEGFKRLREAYNQAIEYARNPEKDEAKEQYDDSPVGRWLSRADELYNDYTKRIDEAEWRALLADDVYFCLDTEMDAKEGLIIFLMSHHFLPGKIWKVLVESLEIKENRKEYAEKFPMDFLEYAINNAEYADNFNYSLFEQLQKGLPYDDFIVKYYQFRSEVSEQKDKEAEATLAILESMPLSHPYVRISKMHLKVLENDMEAADAISKELFESYPDEGNCVMARASYLFQSEKYDEALELYKSCKEQSQLSFSARIGIADCLLGKEEFKEAQTLYKELLNEHHYDAYVHYKLTLCNSSLVEKYTSALKRDPQDMETRIELCWCFYQNNRVEDAYGLIKDRTFDGPLSMDLNYLKGRCLVALQKEKTAKKYFDEWISLFEIYHDLEGEVGKRNRDRQELVYFFKAEIAMKCGKYSEALEFNAKAREHMRLDKDLICTQNAQILYKLKLYDEAMEIFEQANYESYDNIQAILGLGDCYRKKGLIREAVNYYERALFQIPQLPEANAKLVRIYLDEGYPERAEEQLKNFKENDLDSMGMLFCEALIYAEKKEYDKAADLIEKIDNANWNSTEFDLFSCVEADDYYYERSFILLEAGRINTETAIDNIKKLVDRNKDNVNYVYYLSNLYFKARRNQEAEKGYKKALKLRPNNLTIMLSLANTYREMKNNDKEEDMLLKVLQIDPNHPFAHGQLGEIYENEGRVKMALLYYSRQLEVEPSDYYYISRGIMYLELENYKYALADFEQAWKESENNPYAYYNYGRSLLRMGKIAEAEPYLRMAVDKAGDEARTIFYIILARCYCRMRDIIPDAADRVRAVFDDMEKAFPDNPIVFMHKGKCIRALGYLEEAIACFERGILCDKEERYRFKQEIIMTALDVALDEKLAKEYLKKYRKPRNASEYYNEMYYFDKYFGYVEDEYANIFKMEADNELVCYNRAVSAGKMLKKCKSKLKREELIKQMENYFKLSEKFAKKLTERGTDKLLGLRRQALIWIELGDIEKAQEFIEKTESAPICDHCYCKECYELYMAKAKLEILKKDKEKALEYIDYALSLCPDDAEIRLVREQILEM